MRNPARTMLFRCLLIAVLVVPGMDASAQPSGGPYGPLRRFYSLPADAHAVFYVAPGGDESRRGDSPSAPTTIEAALPRARTGDVIVMRGGVYRTGDLRLNQGITIQPYGDEQPVLTGTLIAEGWRNVAPGLWAVHWKRLFPAKPADWWQRDREGQRTPVYRFNNDMVFADGRLLHAVGWEGEVCDSTYYIDYDSARVYVGVDPASRRIEITAHDAAIVRTTGTVSGRPSDGRGYTLRGLTITRYAYRGLEVEGRDPEGLSPESAHGKDVIGTTLEDCTIAFCSRVGAYLRGDRLTVRHCRVSDTRTEGLYIIGSADVLLEGNVFARNNIENITGYYPAAVKIFNQCYRATCRDNLIIDQPFSNGVWYDVGNVDGVFVDNWIQGVGSVRGPVSPDQLWPSANGFFFEISRGAVCAGNVFVDCDHGVMVLNSSDVQVCRNTFVNSVACFGRNARVAAGDRFGWHASTGPEPGERRGHTFIDNLVFGGKEFQRPLLFVWQPAALCGTLTDRMLAACDGNMFVREPAAPASPLILWSPAAAERCQTAFDSLEAMRLLLPDFSLRSRAFIGWDGPLFRNALLGRYELLGDFPGARGGIPLPARVSGLLRGGADADRYVGAYPPVR